MVARSRLVRLLSLIPATYWLFVQLSMASASVAVTPYDADRPAVSQADLIEIVICTPTGFKTVKITPDGNIHEETESHPDCRWCQTFGKVGFIYSPVISCTFIEFEDIALVWNTTKQFTTYAVRANWARSRAPPA